jgi:predicted neutral ceramidase superfamily lipid hydrolase
MMTGANASHAMIFFGVCLGVAIMIAMVVMAISKKSTFQVRIASLIALALMILTVIICVTVYFNAGKVVPVDESVVYVGPPLPPPKADGSGSVVVLILAIFLLVFLGVVVILALREHRRHLPKQ